LDGVSGTDTPNGHPRPVVDVGPSGTYRQEQNAPHVVPLMWSDGISHDRDVVDRTGPNQEVS
jgi:hypothetical protein